MKVVASYIINYFMSDISEANILVIACQKRSSREVGYDAVVS